MNSTEYNIYHSQCLKWQIEFAWQVHFPWQITLSGNLDLLEDYVYFLSTVLEILTNFQNLLLGLISCNISSKQHGTLSWTGGKNYWHWIIKGTLEIWNCTLNLFICSQLCSYYGHFRFLMPQMVPENDVATLSSFVKNTHLRYQIGVQILNINFIP